MNFYEYPQCQEYSCIHTPYNDSTFYETLESSGSLSLGTTAGTDRSISGEFGGSTPHALSEYYCMRDYHACICVFNYYSVSIPLSTSSQSELSVPVGGGGDSVNKLIHICIGECTTNGTNMQVAKGNPLKFSDGYGKTDGTFSGTHPVTYCIFCLEGSKMYTDSLVEISVPHVCTNSISVGGIGTGNPKFYACAASSNCYALLKLYYTAEGGATVCSGNIKLHGGST